VEAVIIFLAAEGRVILWLNASQPISASFTNSDYNTEKPHSRISTYFTQQPISNNLTNCSQSPLISHTGQTHSQTGYQNSSTYFGTVVVIITNKNNSLKLYLKSL